MSLVGCGERPLGQQCAASQVDVAADLRPDLPAALRDHLGSQLQAFYAASMSDEPPKRLLNLIAQLEANLAEQSAADTSTFRNGLLAALPDLRAYARSLAMAPDRADDLVQETLVKAWANQHRFEPGSNLTGWLCTILRNQFYTECRRRGSAKDFWQPMPSRACTSGFSRTQPARRRT
jgi:RNA polymerase sigma-70 factor (ECF subfamily)